MELRQEASVYFDVFYPMLPENLRPTFWNPKERILGQRSSQLIAHVNSINPISQQGVVAKALAEFLYTDLARRFLQHGTSDAEVAQGLNNALNLLDVASGALPVTGEARSIYEAYTGKNIFNGETLTGTERALAVVSVAGIGATTLFRSESVRGILASIKRYATLDTASVERVQSIAHLLEDEKIRWPETLGYLKSVEQSKWEQAVRMAAERKLSKGLPKEISYDYTVGSVSRDRMDLIGRSFVGQEATALTEEGKQFFISSDKLRQYRPPEIKAGGQLRANLQERLKPSGAFITNGHFDIVD